MSEWILLVFVIVNSINPVGVWERIYLCESLSLSVPGSVWGAQPFVSLMSVCDSFPFFFRAFLLYCHTIYAPCWQNHCSGEHPLLCVIIVSDVWNTTTSTSIIHPDWHPPWSSCRGVSFWIVQPTFSFYWTVTKKAKKVAWCSILLLFWKLLYH